MVEDSVDDMYLGCNKEMFEEVTKKYLAEERHMKLYADAWNEAEKCAKEKLKHKNDQALTRDHLEAICVYTGEKVYQQFSEAVRTGKSIYGSSFEFYSLHYLLTSAIQILNSNYYYHTTYRRSNNRFIGKVNQIIRFGSFTSSSYKTDLKNFGNETCFKINTFTGAFLKDYSVYDEAEVLIPPYEMFKITEKIDGQVKIQGLTDCEVLYVLESAGIKSNMNCGLPLLR